MYLPKPLVQGAVLSASAVVYYTAPAGAATRIIQMSITNAGTGTSTINIYICNDGAAPTVDDTSIKSKTLQPNETWVPYQLLGTILPAGGTIQATASAGSTVLKSSGIELTP